ncbi:hypothetical protein FACS1894181_08950 [Bacteroidia bacterium]|nr:hypothetical protein FACS1894181_08950 [Bacteroidia bacterium]
MEKIKKTLRLSSQMLLPQLVEYYTVQKERLEPLVAQVPLLGKSWLPFTTALEALETAYKHALASPLTAKLLVEESGRNNEFTFINNCVNNVLHHSTIAEEVAAARLLEPELINQRGCRTWSMKRRRQPVTTLSRNLRRLP